MAMTMEFSKWFWNPNIWLPPNVTWDTFNDTNILKNDIVIHPQDFAKFSDLLYSLPIALFMIIMRYYMEKNVFKPIGKYFGLSDRYYQNPSKNQVLQDAYKRSSKSSTTDMNELITKTGMTSVQVLIFSVAAITF